MAVTFQVADLTDIVVYAFAAHHIREGEPVRCYKGADGKARARRVVAGEKATGEALHDALPGTPVTVLVCKRGSEQ
jgi:predicted transcriptional regulator